MYIIYWSKNEYIRHSINKKKYINWNCLNVYQHCSIKKKNSLDVQTDSENFEFWCGLERSERGLVRCCVVVIRSRAGTRARDSLIYSLADSTAAVIVYKNEYIYIYMCVCFEIFLNITKGVRCTRIVSHFRAVLRTINSMVTRGDGIVYIFYIYAVVVVIPKGGGGDDGETITTRRKGYNTVMVRV